GDALSSVQAQRGAHRPAGARGPHGGHPVPQLRREAPREAAQRSLRRDSHPAVTQRSRPLTRPSPQRGEGGTNPSPPRGRGQGEGAEVGESPTLPSEQAPPR